jgi:hypothetical protein
VLLESDLLLLFPHLQGQYSRPLTLATFLGKPAPHHCRCHDPCINRITNPCSHSMSANLNILINPSLCPPAKRSHKNLLFSIGSSQTAACPEILVSITQATHSFSSRSLEVVYKGSPDFYSFRNTVWRMSDKLQDVWGTRRNTATHYFIVFFLGTT